MDSNSTSYTFSYNLRIRAHFQPPRPVDSTAYLTPPSWVSMARANPVHRSLHRPPAHPEPPEAPAYRQSTRLCLRAIPCPLRQKPTRTAARLRRAASHEQGNPRDPTLVTNDPAASLHPPRRAAPRSTRTPPASDLQFLTAGPPARRRKRSPDAPDSTRRPIPAPPPHAAAPPLAPHRPANGTKSKQAPRAHEPPKLLPLLLKQAATAFYALLWCPLSPTLLLRWQSHRRHRSNA
jgi:hypothetical protein